MNIETLLEERIQHVFEELKELTVDSEAYKAKVDELTKLYDRYNENKKINVDFQDKTEAREAENDLKRKEMEEEKKDRWIKNGIAAASIVIPVMLTVWGVGKTFEFEKEGVVTTMMGRGFINKLIPKK